MHALRLARLAANVSFTALALRAGLAAETLLAIEDGRRTATPDQERQLLAALAAIEAERKAKKAVAE